jgi:hypothetical protein
MNKYKKTKGNNELFEQFALEIVSRMLLFERIKLQSKALYLEAIKEEIYKYEDTYHQEAHDRLVLKLSETKIQSFETVVHIFKIEFQPPASTQKLIEHDENALAEMFYHCSEDKKLEHVRNWLKRPPRALPKCYLDWVKQLPEDEKQTLRDLRKETTRRFNEGFLSQDNAGKNIDQVFSEYQERQKMQAVENWLKYCKRPLPKCFKEFIEKQTEGEKDRLREIYTDSHGSKNAIHRVLDKIDFETGEIIIT